MTDRDDAPLRITLEEAALSDVMQDVITLGWGDMMGRLAIERGSSDQLALWDPIFRALRDGIPVYEVGTVEFRESDRSSMQLQQSFRLDDDPETIGHFLAEAGYLHVRNVFTADEMEAVSGELDAAIQSAEQDDGQSWWARAGDDWYPSRILGFNRKSPTLRELLASDRFRTLTSFVEDDLVQGDIDATDMAEGLLKKVGVQEGISDVSWHKDCGPGGHSFGCSSLIVGIQLTGSDRQTGELGVMAGSNRANIPGLRPVADFGLPRIAIPTSQGACTIHCSCTMHMSRPPVSAERRVVYTGFSLARLSEDNALVVSEADRRKDRAALQNVVGKGSGGTSEQLSRLPLPG